MFAIIISEKGGAERKDSFDKNEINVGRVQGNDLMLPKGNVSKHHARLLFRDGRFIVTDLKSTNGTYVNGRKIAQATIVREGDKIYIGDFVLRLETTGASAAPSLEALAGAVSSETAGVGMAAPEAGTDHAVSAQAPHSPFMAQISTQPPGQPPGSLIARGQAANSTPPLPQGGRSPEAAGGASSLPSHDPDDSAPAQPGRMPSGAVPAVVAAGAAAAAGTGVAAPRPVTMPLNPIAPSMLGQRIATMPPAAIVQPSSFGSSLLAGPALTSAPVVALAHGPLPLPTQLTSSQPASSSPIASSSVPLDRAFDRQERVQAQPRPPSPPVRMPLKESPAQAGRRLALTMLMGRIADAVDLAPLRTTPSVPDALGEQIERAARDQANAMREEGEAPEDVDLDAIVRDAHAELVGLGALAPLLEDEEVSEIHCVRYDQIVTVRTTGAVVQTSGFSSEEALRRVMARLAEQSGEAWRPEETIFDRRLPRASLVGLVPPAAAHGVLSLRKRQRTEGSLEDLTRASAISRPMAQFLEACVAARTNILVSGVGSGAVLSALASSGAAEGRVCVVQDVEEIAVTNAHPLAVSIVNRGERGEDSVRAAARLRPERLVVAELAGGVTAAIVEAMAEGSEGVIAAIAAPSLRQALSRLVAQLVIRRPGVSLEAMRDVVGEAFDIALEVARLPDGRLRITRIAELGGSDAKGIVSRDVFAFNVDPQGGEGTFSATGIVPRFVTDLIARGVKIDPALFKRAGR